MVGDESGIVRDELGIVGDELGIVGVRSWGASSWEAIVTDFAPTFGRRETKRLLVRLL